MTRGRRPAPGLRAYGGRRFPGAGPREAYGELVASELYCPRCRAAVPVRERLLLILPDGELYEYRCSRCGSSVGEKTSKGREDIKIVL